MTVNFRDIIERAENGPYFSAAEWDTKLIPSNLKEVVKEHGLEKTYDPTNPINSDDGLADEYFKAGWDMALKTGLFCTSTERIVKVDEDELKSILKVLPKQINLGKYGSKDAFLLKHRNPEDTYPPYCSGGGCSTTEDFAIPRACSALQYHVIDGGMAGIPKKFHGMEPKAGAPTEYMWGVYFARTTLEVHKRVNRTGLPFGVGGSSFNMMAGMVAVMLEEGAAGFSAVPAISELKFSYDELTRVAMCLHLNIPNKAFHHPMMGGYAGGPETSAVMRVAGSLLLMPIFQSPWTDSCVYDIRYACNTSRQSIWASSIGCQALARNTELPHGGYNRAPFPPGTDLLLYAGALPVLSETTSGASHINEGLTPVVQTPNYSTGLEQMYGCELAKVVSKSGFKRSDANEIAKQLIPKYEDKLGKPPTGKSFEECMDLKTLKPKPEWLAIYNTVRKELTDLGIPY